MVMNHGAEAHTTGTQLHFGIFEPKMKKNTKAHSQPWNMPQVDSSAEQNLSSNSETLHHARAVKSPTRQQW